MNAIDTNVLIYFIDGDDPVKQKIAIDLLRKLSRSQTQTVLPWQVGVEFLSCLRRWENAGRTNRADTLRHIRQMETTFEFVFPSRKVLLGSLDISSRHSLSHWDSLCWPLVSKPASRRCTPKT